MSNYQIETKCIQSGWQPGEGTAKSASDCTEHHF